MSDGHGMHGEIEMKMVDEFWLKRFMAGRG
jgi:hypothetical protein